MLYLDVYLSNVNGFNAFLFLSFSVARDVFEKALWSLVMVHSRVCVYVRERDSKHASK